MSRPYLIVAVDDDPERYTHLQRMVAPMGWVVVTVEHPDALTTLLDFSPIPVLAVMLDHDLRPVWADGLINDAPKVWVEVEGRSGSRHELREITGQDYARMILAERNVPVIISSANRAGAAQIAAILREYETPFAVLSVMDLTPEERWVGRLALWAAERGMGGGE